MTTQEQIDNTFNVMKKYIEEMEDFFGGDEDRFSSYEDYQKTKKYIEDDIEYTLLPMKHYIEEMEDFFGGDEDRFETHEDYHKVKDIVDKVYKELTSKIDF